MASDFVTPHRDALLARARPDGSFAVAPGADSRPDATAWAAVALYTAGGADKQVAAARESLAAVQRPDGSVPVIPERKTAAWPTALAILAWLPDPAYRPRAEAAVAWLLAHPGSHWPKSPNDVFAHGPAASVRPGRGQQSHRGFPLVQPGGQGRPARGQGAARRPVRGGAALGRQPGQGHDRAGPGRQECRRGE